MARLMFAVASADAAGSRGVEQARANYKAERGHFEGYCLNSKTCNSTKSTSAYTLDTTSCISHCKLFCRRNRIRIGTLRQGAAAKRSQRPSGLQIPKCYAFGTYGIGALANAVFIVTRLVLAAATPNTAGPRGVEPTAYAHSRCCVYACPQRSVDSGTF